MGRCRGNQAMCIEVLSAAIRHHRHRCHAKPQALGVQRCCVPAPRHAFKHTLAPENVDGGNVISRVAHWGPRRFTGGQLSQS